MHILFPEIKPYKTHEIAVDGTHVLYVEESGNPDGLPVVFLHGGPGAGCSKHDRRYFDPEIYRIVLFDQRGAGRSRPHAELTDNNSELLVGDMELIRNRLKIERWVLFGGSWGATLALLYAESHPDRVSYMILRGIFLCREEDLTWFYQEGAHRIFPDYWRDYLAPIPTHERSDMIGAYYRKLTGSNELAKMGAAKAWSQWEGRCATLRPNPEVVDRFTDPHMAVALARIEAHYFYNRGFMSPDQIVQNAGELAGIPGVIIHGRYDMVCPVDNALALSAAWPDSELLVVRDAGHSASEPGIIDALVRATHDAAAFLEGEADDLS